MTTFGNQPVARKGSIIRDVEALAPNATESKFEAPA